MRTLDDPTMPPQPFAAFDTAACDTGLDAALSQITSATSEVMPFVSVQFARALARLTVQARYRRNGIKRGLECHRIVSFGPRDRDSQRNAACIYDDVSLRFELAAVGRVGAGFLAPGAGDTGSIDAHTLPIDLVVLTQPTQHRQMQPMPYTGRLPARRRRQHVMPLPKPSSCGRSSHGIPVCSTYRMPLSAARSSTVRRCPPLRRGSELRDQRSQRHPQLIADFASCHAADDTTFAAPPLGCVSDSNTTIGRSHHLLRCGTGTRLVSFFASPGSMPPRSARGRHRASSVPSRA